MARLGLQIGSSLTEKINGLLELSNQKLFLFFVSVFRMIFDFEFQLSLSLSLFLFLISLYIFKLCTYKDKIIIL